jgi:hypothetical protein
MPRGRLVKRLAETTAFLRVVNARSVPWLVVVTRTVISARWGVRARLSVDRRKEIRARRTRTGDDGGWRMRDNSERKKFERIMTLRNRQRRRTTDVRYEPRGAWDRRGRSYCSPSVTSQISRSYRAILSSKLSKQPPGVLYWHSLSWLLADYIHARAHTHTHTHTHTYAHIVIDTQSERCV